MYSYAILLWEIAAAGLDPFDDVTDDGEVMDLVRTGSRPSMDVLTDVLQPPPQHYKQLINVCWSQEPDDRPSFKQVKNYSGRNGVRS